MGGFSGRLGTDDLGRDIFSRLVFVVRASLIIAVGLVAISGPSLANAAVALGIAHIPAMIRVVRGETLRIKESDFVLAAKTMDASGGRIIFQHVLPNTASALVVQATVIMPVAVIGEALLSFLGLGIQPPSPSLAFNLFGDALRDALDPTVSSRK